MWRGLTDTRFAASFTSDGAGATCDMGDDGGEPPSVRPWRTESHHSSIVDGLRPMRALGNPELGEEGPVFVSVSAGATWGLGKMDLKRASWSLVVNAFDLY